MPFLHQLISTWICTNFRLIWKIFVFISKKTFMPIFFIDFVELVLKRSASKIFNCLLIHRSNSFTLFLNLKKIQLATFFKALTRWNRLLLMNFDTFLLFDFCLFLLQLASGNHAWKSLTKKLLYYDFFYIVLVVYYPLFILLFLVFQKGFWT